MELCTTPTHTDPAWQTVTIPAGVRVTTQGQGDLGARMAQAAQRCLGAFLLIGTDCVEMRAELLQEAATTLQSVDAILHVTADGGYALLGLQKFHPSLFTEMAWSTETVAEETIRRIRGLGWSLHLGDTLNDVDEPQDLLQHPAFGLCGLPIDQPSKRPGC